MKTSPKYSALLATAMVAPAMLFGASSANAQPRAVSSEAQLSVTNRMVQAPAAEAIFARLNATAPSRAPVSAVDRLLLWNEIMLDSNALDHTPGALSGDQNGPTRNSRAFAMIQIAVFDAVNSFGGRFKPYHDIGRAPAGASVGAAIAYAAHDTLVALYPKQKSRLDLILAQDVAAIRARPVAIAAGKTIGQAAANAMIDSRIDPVTKLATDGATAGERNFGEGGIIAGGVTANINVGATAAPNWTQDPVGRNSSGNRREVALGAFWGNVKPFVLQQADMFRIPPPPQPGTPAYQAGFAEVTAVGASTDTAGSTSTERQRFIGNFWGYDGAPLLGTPPRLYNQIAIKVANDQGLTNVTHYARYLALVNATMGDSGIAAWDSKYFYNYWRPVVGVRTGAADGSTPANPDWKPVGASVINSDHAELFTPPFPAYPSGHATFGAALFQTMRAFFPDNTRFTFTSDEYNGVGLDPNGTPRPLAPVRFRSFQQAQEENGKSRVYNGVHWEWDNSQGQSLGVNIARYALAHAFQRQRAAPPPPAAAKAAGPDSVE
jgi:hypothetical protein